MTFWLLKTVLRDNWHLAAILAGVLAVGGYLQYLNGEAASGGAEAASVAPATDVPLRAASPDRASPQRQARALIAEHKARFSADPKAKEAPALLSAMGNLYRQKLGDYGNAAQCYELLIHDYPEWEGAGATLIKLATCYERLNDRESLHRVYRDMMRFFPPDSQEYAYAKAQLGE